MSKTREKNNFAVACSLLSRYIKEKRAVPELGCGIVVKGKSEAVWPPATMSLLPGSDVAGDDRKKGDIAAELFPQRTGLGSALETKKSSEVREQEKAQLTIFYDGKVLVFNNIPAEKAKDLMQFACKSATSVQNFGYAPHETHVPAVDSKMASSNPVKNSQNTNQKPAGSTVSNIPIAPRASLQRFLEKRKHRISAAAPYPTSSPDPVKKPEEIKSLLGLTSQPSTPSVSLNSDSNW